MNDLKRLARAEDAMMLIMRVSLAVIFIWFGLLKMAGFNPVYDIIYATFPYLADGSGLVLLGLAETFIGIALLFNWFSWAVHLVLIGHLLGTLLTFVTGPEIMFDPHFPMLSLSGEFVFKNIALAAAGLVVLIHERRKSLL